MPVSGRCSPERRRQRGSLLLGQLLGLALLSFVLAQAMASFCMVQRTTLLAEQRLSRREEARWVLRQLAQDLSLHGRLGCLQVAWRRDDFSPQAWALALPGRLLRHRSPELDQEGSLRRLPLEAQDGGNWRDWRDSRLVSCGRSYRLAGTGGHWSDAAGALALDLEPALPAWSADGLHLPSLQLWLPRQRHYRLQGRGADGRLLQRDALGGIDEGGERVLLEGVRSLSLQVLAQTACGQDARWAWRDINALTDGEADRLVAARVAMEWYPDKEGKVIQLNHDVALTPLQPCGAGL
ncbi:hypothetical protein [Chromobacterium sphagni]|uniref:Uncharacterized protein n=1 Tax=Chromobacterium sphagni TaxID=1903179 RepID=A0A1S1WZA7_9NEIS|nr:hypothetical protein [Chromobacterium sphagni]OHX12641.1 hypothetical protein BI347_03335 [Chromobacterium sphagni]OHX21275.1 hypothetical protein BI344_01670 [Chromobacterium sphagni]